MNHFRGRLAIYAKTKEEDETSQVQAREEARDRGGTHENLRRKVSRSHVVMDKGKYTGRRVDFSKYAASCFNPFLFSGLAHSSAGCGAAALALLTGIPPETVRLWNGARKHYSDRFMVGFLRRRGYGVLRITLCNLSEASTPLSTTNVILVSQLFRKNEGTWGILYGELYYHNFDVYQTDVFSFLNRPMLSAYVVTHPRWRRFLTVKQQFNMEVPSASQLVKTKRK